MKLTYDDIFTFANTRETLVPNDKDFFAYKDAYERANILIKDLQKYIDIDLYNLLIKDLTIHYIITCDYTYDGEQNPLFVKYDIKEKSKGIISSVSDEGSSASLHINDALQSLDFLGMDLISSPYGKRAYALLSQLNIIPILL